MDSNLEKKWSKHEGMFQDFVDAWTVNDTCSLTKWCRRQGNVDMKTGVAAFYEMAARSPEHAKWVHYHIGWTLDYEILLDLTHIVCNNAMQAALMWIEDETLTDEQDEILVNCFRDPITGAPVVTEEIDSGLLVRKKNGAPKQYNNDSEIVIARIHGASN